jgi:hypothetical protein
VLALVPGPSFLDILLARRFVPSSSFPDPRSWHSGSWRSGSWTLRVLKALEALEALNGLGGHRSLRGLRLPSPCLQVVAGCTKGVSWMGLSGWLRIYFKREARQGVSKSSGRASCVQISEREQVREMVYKKV